MRGSSSWQTRPMALAAMLLFTATSASAAPVVVVVCASDGQTGQMSAQARDIVPKLLESETSRLAYYEGVGLGVFAPIGWHCFGLDGSNGSTLIVTPEQHGEDLLTSHEGLVGPAVQLTVSFGDTSGRFEAAEIAARLFPSRRRFVEAVMAEEIEPRSSFHFGPFPTDTIHRFGNDVVEFETPARIIGMGSKSRLVPNNDPIFGLAIITPRNSVSLLVVRLPESQRDLATTIIETIRDGKKSLYRS